MWFVICIYFSLQVVDNFDDMNLKEELLRGIYAYGFEKPSAIQQRAIIPCVKGHDVIAQAQSGMFLSPRYLPHHHPKFLFVLIFHATHGEDLILADSALQSRQHHQLLCSNSVASAM